MFIKLVGNHNSSFDGEQRDENEQDEQEDMRGGRRSAFQKESLGATQIDQDEDMFDLLYKNFEQKTFKVN